MFQLVLNYTGFFHRIPYLASMWVARRKIEALEARLRLVEGEVKGLQGLDPRKAIEQAVEANQNAALLMDRLHALNARLVKRLKDQTRSAEETAAANGETGPPEGDGGEPPQRVSKADLRRYARQRGML